MPFSMAPLQRHPGCARAVTALRVLGALSLPLLLLQLLAPPASLLAAADGSARKPHDDPLRDWLAQLRFRLGDAPLSTLSSSGRLVAALTADSNGAHSPLPANAAEGAPARSPVAASIALQDVQCGSLHVEDMSAVALEGVPGADVNVSDLALTCTAAWLSTPFPSLAAPFAIMGPPSGSSNGTLSVSVNATQLAFALVLDIGGWPTMATAAEARNFRGRFDVTNLQAEGEPVWVAWLLTHARAALEAVIAQVLEKAAKTAAAVVVDDGLSLALRLTDTDLRSVLRPPSPPMPPSPDRPGKKLETESRRREEPACKSRREPPSFTHGE